MYRLVRKMLWVSFVGGIAVGGWSFWKLRGAKDELPRGNWSPLAGEPATSAASGSDHAPSATPTTPTHAKAAPPSGGTAETASGATASGATASQGFAAPAPDDAKAAAGHSEPLEPPPPHSQSATPPSGTAKPQPSDVSRPPSGAKWVEPASDGSCPVDFPIKANDDSMIFHLPDGSSYTRTKAERCYAKADDAIADGYRASKR